MAKSSGQPVDTAQSLDDLWSEFEAIAEQIRSGGGTKAAERQRSKGRLTARERIDLLLDAETPRIELGLWAGYQMYQAWGGAPAAGVITVIGQVEGRPHLIVANDATVKAGAFFPATAKKVLRAQRIAYQNRLPLIYLVDSAGVFLPLQEDVFPDEDDFGRIFCNNARLSACGIPQIAAIMGNCVAGGGYLPVLCDKLLMTEGSGLYLAGPALVKSAIGQDVSHEELGGAAMHAGLSGTIDYREADDPTCLMHIRDLVRSRGADLPSPGPPFQRLESVAPKRTPKSLSEFISVDRQQQYDIHDVLDCVVDGDTFREYKAEFGPSLVCGTACVGGFPVGIVANQRQQVTTSEGQYQYGGVIYVDSADKAARFVLSCNQDWIPLLFFQDVNGFMVGKESEKAGIIKAGAKLVNAVSNSRVPKITTLIGGSYGAGNYALCGKAFDPSFIFGWPTAKCAVMGGAQATSTLVDITIKSQERDGEPVDEANMEQLRTTVMGDYERQMDARYAASRGWLDALIDPTQTRNVLIHSLELVTRQAPQNSFSLGVFQV